MRERIYLSAENYQNLTIYDWCLEFLFICCTSWGCKRVGEYFSATLNSFMDNEFEFCVLNALELFSSTPRTNWIFIWILINLFSFYRFASFSFNENIINSILPAADCKAQAAHLHSPIAGRASFAFNEIFNVFLSSIKKMKDLHCFSLAAQ